ncbi:mechanosensitive channel MscK [Pseudomonas sp. sia0905]|uniref:mechanosensitive channel MscK n=1 Tax=Pseudomonas sp. sia0905 TaxID=2854783 RepID=UPI00352704A4
MHSFRRLLAVFLLGLCLANSPAWADANPTAADVQRSLDTLADRKLAEPELTQVRQTLEKTLDSLNAQADSQQKLAALQKQLAQAPRQTQDAHRELEKLKATKVVPVAQRYASTSVAQLEQILSERSAQLSDWQKQLNDANTLIVTAQTRPERAQAEISSNQTRAQQINSQLKNGREDGKPLSAERVNQLKAELAQLGALTQLRRQEMAGNSVMQDLGTAQRDLFDERVRRLDVELQDLQNLINEKRRDQSERTVAEQSMEAEKVGGSDSLLARESAINLKLSDYLLRGTDRLNELTQLNLRTQQQLDTLNQTDQALDEQINVLQGSLLLSKILYKQRQSLPKLKLDNGLADEIADIRLYQFELNQQREQISNPSAYVDKQLAAQPPESVTPELRESLLDLIDTRRALHDRLNRELNSLLNESITLQLNQKQLKDTATALRATLDEQMFWIPSNNPLNLEWFKTAPAQLQRQISELPWLDNMSQLGAGLIERPLLFLPLLLVMGLLFYKRHYLSQKLTDLHKDIGHFKRDSQLHTPVAILLNVLLALPGSLFLALCGFALQMDARGLNVNLGSAFLGMAQAWLVFYTVYRIFTPGGVAELHFHWARAHVAYLHRQIRWLGVVVMALVAVVTVAEYQPSSLSDDVIGIAVVLTCYGLMIWLLQKLLLRGPARENASTFRMFIGVLFSVLPLGLFLAVCFGYYYTALKLSDRLIDTLYLLLIWLVVEAMFVRGLAVAARRLAYQRAVSKREAQTTEDGEGTEIQLDMPTLDIEQVNQQSLRLIRLTLLGSFIAAMYWVWADLISVFAYLDNITLYEYNSSTVTGAGSASSLVPISLLDALYALIIAAITLALGRNLPGLLEVLVLSRLRLAQGSAYATTTLLSYVIFGTGIVVTLSTLGVSWNKLQWLVAALSVGIGFGMQEIFANFISGLIILFERPVRIGDLVTIGTVTGTVKRIHIRATHIIDSDRKEVIVPNKTFVTSQLINWTLTDTVTRIVLTFKVNRGADLEKVRTLLLQAAQENSRVMRDPAPTAQLSLYAPDGLTHELKIYVKELGDRGVATDELNRRVDQLFADNDINLSSTPKMDIVLSRAAAPHDTLKLDDEQLASAEHAEKKDEAKP